MKALVQTLRFLVCAGLMSSSLFAQRLTNADRETLLDNLEKLRSAATAKVDAKYSTALNAFRAAMSSDDQAIELYLSCYEKVNYTDQQKKSQDFREWKRKEAGSLADQSFRKALRLQLAWLVVTLQAASERPNKQKLASDAEGIVDTIFNSADKLEGQEKIVGQSPTSTVFARAYDINRIKVEDWPSSPTDLASVYDLVILPPLRSPNRLAALRAEWLKRIQQEIAKHQYWETDHSSKRIGMLVPSQPSDTDKFVTETVPQLRWDMELDLFTHGDESGAAVRMLSILGNNISHPSARKWAEQFQELLTPQAPPSAESPATTTPSATAP